jgi:hypothetical protein
MARDASRGPRSGADLRALARTLPGRETVKRARAAAKAANSGAPPGGQAR